MLSPDEANEPDVARSVPIYLSAPDVGELEQRFVLEAMRSGWVAPAGPDLASFEREIADRVGRRHAVALSSGTAALHLALVAWRIGPGDVVPVSTLTFAATINAIRYVGAEPHFVDSEPESGNISPMLLREALEKLRADGRNVPVVVPVDLLGKSVDYTAIIELAAEFGARVLSDSAESFGASYRGRPVGFFGDAAVLSFNGNKVMTTSGGGMLLTDDSDLAAHVRKLSTQAREPVAHYEHTEIGYNYRLSNILAALGRAQLTRLDAMIERRRTWRCQYRAALAGCRGVRILGGESDADDNCWLTAVIADDEAGAGLLASLAGRLNELDAETRPLWKPMHLQPVFADTPATLDGTAERLFERGLTLPSGSGMTDDQFAAVLAAVRAALA